MGAPQSWIHCPLGDVVIFLKRLVNVDSSNMPRVTKDITWANWHICILPKMIGTRITILHIENDGRWLAFNKHQTWTKQINTMYPDHNDLIKWKHFPRYWPLVRGIIRQTKTSVAELWCFLWSSPEQTVEQTIETPVIWDAIAPIMTWLLWMPSVKNDYKLHEYVFLIHKQLSPSSETYKDCSFSIQRTFVIP